MHSAARFVFAGQQNIVMDGLENLERVNLGGRNNIRYAVDTMVMAVSM